MSDRLPFELGDPRRDAYLLGARDEAKARSQGMDDKTREIYETIEVLSEQGRSATAVVRLIATVFTCEWTLKQRIALALAIIKG